MKVYLFGNQDMKEDSWAFEIAKNVEGQVEGIEFVHVKPNEDLPFVDEPIVVIMDTVYALKEVRLFEGEAVDKLVMPPRNSAHDFDLNFQLKYLKKLGKLGEVKIIGIPMDGNINYSSIHSIFKKLVAQDMQGS